MNWTRIAFDSKDTELSTNSEVKDVMNDMLKEVNPGMRRMGWDRIILGALAAAPTTLIATMTDPFPVFFRWRELEETLRLFDASMDTTSESLLRFIPKVDDDTATVKFKLHRAPDRSIPPHVPQESRSVPPPQTPVQST